MNPVWDKELDVVNSGEKDRLAVDSFISNPFTNPIPVIFSGGTLKVAKVEGQSITSGQEYTVLNYDWSGIFDFISVQGGNDFELILSIDETGGS